MVNKWDAVRKVNRVLPSEECRLAKHPQGIVDENKDGEDPDSQGAFEQNLEIPGIEMVQPRGKLLRTVKSMKRRLLIPH
jgi:hypothetical protein